MKSTPSKGKASTKSTSKREKSAPAAEDMLDYVATAAYYHAEARGFAPGMELDDWLRAEAKFNEQRGL